MAKDNLIIRPAKLEDAPTIGAFNQRLALETEGRELEPTRVLAGVTAVLTRPELGTYFVAELPEEEETALAGQMLITTEWSDWRNGAFWWIQSVFVTEAFRGRGIFKALYHHVHGLARSRADVSGLRLYVEAENQNARRAYERMGMKATHYQFFELDFLAPG